MPNRIDWIQEYLPWVYALSLSLVGSTVHVIQKVRAGEALSGTNLLIDGVVCVFTGSIAFYLCQWQAVDGWLASTIISLSAHSGPRALGIYTKLNESLISRFK